MGDQTLQPTEAPVAIAAARGTRNTVLLLVFTAITNLADGVTQDRRAAAGRPGV